MRNGFKNIKTAKENALKKDGRNFAGKVKLDVNINVYAWAKNKMAGLFTFRKNYEIIPNEN